MYILLTNFFANFFIISSLPHLHKETFSVVWVEFEFELLHDITAAYDIMPTFDNKTYVRPGHSAPTSIRLNRRISRHPVLLFGIPFISIILAGAYVLKSTQTVRYERRDSKVKLVTEEEQLGLEHGRRKVDAREEYYRLQAKGLDGLDEWEQKRVERLPGQKDNVLGEG